jgi:hypothetical protein
MFIYIVYIVCVGSHARCTKIFMYGQDANWTIEIPFKQGSCHTFTQSILTLLKYRMRPPGSCRLHPQRGPDAWLSRCSAPAYDSPKFRWLRFQYKLARKNDFWCATCRQAARRDKRKHAHVHTHTHQLLFIAILCFLLRPESRYKKKKFTYVKGSISNEEFGLRCGVRLSRASYSLSRCKYVETHGLFEYPQTWIQEGWSHESRPRDFWVWEGRIGPCHCPASVDPQFSNHADWRHCEYPTYTQLSMP